MSTRPHFGLQFVDQLCEPSSTKNTPFFGFGKNGCQCCKEDVKSHYIVVSEEMSAKLMLLLWCVDLDGELLTIFHCMLTVFFVCSASYLCQCVLFCVGIGMVTLRIDFTYACS